MLGAAAAAVIFTGCSSMTGEQTASVNANNAVVSTLSFVPSTDPIVLTRWPKDWNIQSIDSYTFVVPEKVADTGNLPTFNANLEPGTVFVEAAGADRPARAMQVVRYAPSSH